MKPFKSIFLGTIIVLIISSCNPTKPHLKKEVSKEKMQSVYEEVQTPFKYGIIFQHPDSTKLIDSPTIFKKDESWYMTYIVFDGQGYETWLAQSEDLLQWESKGKILSFTENTWDANQKAGYVSLVNYDWGGNYNVEKHQDRYWMTYLGGNTTGYEAGILKVGLADTKELVAPKSWNTNNKPILSPEDKNVRWFENRTIYKSLVIKDTLLLTGHEFLMYYNAKGKGNFESIGMAVSNDMKTWKRFGKDPVITRDKGICGDAQIAKINDVYVMFYFGAFWRPGAFETFACSYDLVNWTNWKGPDLVAPSEPYDTKYAHKPWVIKWNNVVYHFYNAVGDQGRVIALATSKDLKKDQL